MIVSVIVFFGMCVSVTEALLAACYELVASTCHTFKAVALTVLGLWMQGDGEGQCMQGLGRPSSSKLVEHKE